MENRREGREKRKKRRESSKSEFGVIDTKGIEQTVKEEGCGDSPGERRKGERAVIICTGRLYEGGKELRKKEK